MSAPLSQMDFWTLKATPFISFPFPPKIIKSPPKCITAEHDHKYSSIFEAFELEKECAVYISESSVRKQRSLRQLRIYLVINQFKTK